MTGQSQLPPDLDEITLRRARDGDLRACEAIYRTYDRRVFTLARRICGCPDLAHDIMQDAFIKALSALDSFSGQVPFWAWLRRIVSNTAISALRKKQPDYSEHAVDQLDTEERPTVQIDLQQAFAQLDAEDRTVVWLHDVEGMKHREIAEITGQSESYSKSRLSRARSRLRDYLGDAATEPRHQASQAMWT